MMQIPRSLLPDTATVKVLDTESDYGGKYKKPVTIGHVRYERVMSLRATDYVLADGTSGLMWVDAVNSDGAFELHELDKVSIDGGKTWSVVNKCHPYETFAGKTHHWELELK